VFALYQENPTPNLADFLNRVFEADCLEKMKDTPSKSIDMILCDLPNEVTKQSRKTLKNRKMSNWIASQS
jgi:DNA modification methylase